MGERGLPRQKGTRRRSVRHRRALDLGSAEPPVALVEANIKTDAQRELAKAYLDFLYTPAAQAIIFANFYRGWDTSKADPADVARFPKLELVDIAHFGGWSKVQKVHFADGGVFDQIYVAK